MHGGKKSHDYSEIGLEFFAETRRLGASGAHFGRIQLSDPRGLEPAGHFVNG